MPYTAFKNELAQDQLPKVGFQSKKMNIVIPPVQTSGFEFSPIVGTQSKNKLLKVPLEYQNDPDLWYAL